MALEVAMSDEKLHRPIGGLLWPCVFKIKNGRRYVERASRSLPKSVTWRVLGNGIMILHD
ncbi:hypothetical protein PABG_12463 [Paracoccidioides brasiliensis Pb03]|uniref:Uncharacterized protein n=1 Tax=Paracoccidioides brasiliensis TaxID=121759 RepID=A0A1D2JHV3_PARBR|nr:hypothetical protein PABG_12463 [Paracoccidioides brasiliensis Pb03]ODH36478.1 hypothetical protein ACO22_02760 [Paracoccidioides brasiliensis]